MPQPSVPFAWTQPSPAVGQALVCGPLAAVATHLFTTGHLALRDEPGEWAALGEAVGAGAGPIRLVRQVHGKDVAVVRRGDASARERPEADIVMTDDPAVAIAIRVADCAPILIADTWRHAVAAVHAGWRGTMEGAASVAVAALRREFGCDPAGLIAAIGPCLGVCCGEVGPEVPLAFSTAGYDAEVVERWFSLGPGGRPHVNLARANREQLEAAGVPAASIHSADLCTRSYPNVFHSYRAAGPGGGRMAAVIRIGGG